jgi:hypothetical protein
MSRASHNRDATQPHNRRPQKGEKIKRPKQKQRMRKKKKKKKKKTPE